MAQRQQLHGIAKRSRSAMAPPVNNAATRSRVWTFAHRLSMWDSDVPSRSVENRRCHWPLASPNRRGTAFESCSSISMPQSTPQGPSGANSLGRRKERTRRLTRTGEPVSSLLGEATDSSPTRDRASEAACEAALVTRDEIDPNRDEIESELSAEATATPAATSKPSRMGILLH